MKAIVQTRYGAPDSVLSLQEIPKPVPGPGEVLVRVRAASVHADVWHVVAGFPYILRLMGNGARRPLRTVPGTDLAGIVESTGPGTTRFRAGDEVFGETIKGMQWVNGGSFAEYACAHEDSLALKPANVGFEQAACVPTSGLIAYYNLKLEGRIRPGHKVLINGAGGGVGGLALQLAKAFGAHVTAVETTAKLDLVRSLGADRVIDFTKEDCADGSSRYDLILDVASTLAPSAWKRALAPEGVYVIIGHDHYGTAGRRWLGSIPQVMGLMVRSINDKRLPKPRISTPPKREAMEELAALLADGKLAPIIDRCFPLGEVHAALRLLQSGRAMGRILLTP